MNILIDTNIALDVLLQRTSFVTEASKIMVLSEKGIIDSYISVSAITDIFYIIQKAYKDTARALQLIKDLLKTVSPATVTDNNIYQALDMDWNDFEDAVQYTAGVGINAEYIVTRNPDDFVKSTIAVVTPGEFLAKVTK
jgi:predicted nucleic acid-binding protein